MSDEDEVLAEAEAIDRMEPLLVGIGGLCWWCRSRAATTSEHKFKSTDLARLMGDGDLLIWGDSEGNRREVRGKSGIKRDRHGVVKFPKSMCGVCNNDRSQPLDAAYETYSSYLATHRILRASPWMNMQAIYGDDWATGALSLARYHAKHFACRMADSRVPIPESLRAFLDGDHDMPDARMTLTETESVRRAYGRGYSLSPNLVAPDRQFTRFVYYVFVYYVGAFGVRYEWRADGILDNERSQFFHSPTPFINRFRTEDDVFSGNVRPPSRLARLIMWSAP